MKVTAIKICSALLLLSTAAVPVAAQQSTSPPLAAMPVPGELELAKMIWSTLAALDHANQSGNYSVLRDLSAPGFQSVNNPSQLSNIFANLRESRLDLSNTLLLAPTYSAAPSVGADNILKVQGFFGLRPTAITSAPSVSRSRAISLPMPAEAPVTTATVPTSDPSMGLIMVSCRARRR